MTRTEKVDKLGNKILGKEKTKEYKENVERKKQVQTPQKV